MIVLLGIVCGVSFVAGGVAMIGAEAVFHQILGAVLWCVSALSMTGAGIIWAIHHPAWQRPMQVQPQPQAWPQQPPVAGVGQ